MRALFVLAVAGTLLTAPFATALRGATGPIPLNCDRACLEGVIDQYLKALVAHDPSRLPLSKDVKFTENNQVMDVGDGFWKTAEGIGNYRHVFADPEFGQVAAMGTMLEAGTPILMSVRLRIELGRITEIEAVYFKPGGGGPNNIAAMDTAKPEDMWFKSIPPAQRLTRQQMISVADGYFTGLQKNDGKGIQGTGTYPFTTDCHRIENGSPTTNVPKPATAAPGSISPFWFDCLTSSRWASTTSCRTSTTGVIRWSTPSAASCGRMSCSIRGRSTRACCPTAPSTAIQVSTARPASWSPRRS